MNKVIAKVASIAVGGMFLTACAGASMSDQRQQVEKPNAPVVSNYNEALACLGRYMEPISLTVGMIEDATQQITISDGGTGSYLSGGGTDMMMRAAHLTGKVRLLNSADFETEKIISTKTGQPYLWDEAPEYMVVGSISRLDLGGGGSESLELGYGPVQGGIRSIAAIAGGEFFLQDVRSGEILVSTTVEKKLSGMEAYLGFADFLGGDDELGSLDASVKRKVPLQMAQNAMLKIGIYELLAGFADETLRQEECDPYIHEVAEGA